MGTVVCSRRLNDSVLPREDRGPLRRTSSVPLACVSTVFVMVTERTSSVPGATSGLKMVMAGVRSAGGDCAALSAMKMPMAMTRRVRMRRKSREDVMCFPPDAARALSMSCEGYPAFWSAVRIVWGL